MSALDPRTMIAMGMLMAALMAVVLFFMRRQYPAHIHGLDWWAAAPLAWLVSALLFSLRGALPDFITGLLANLLLLLGALSFYLGCRRFHGHGLHWRPWAALAAAMVLGFAFFTYVQPQYSARLVIITTLMLVVYSANLVFLHRHGTRGLPQRLVLLVLGAHICVLLLRLVTVFMGEGGDGLLQASLYQNLYVGSYVVTVLLLSIGAVLMASDRLSSELEHLATHDGLTQALNRRALLQLGQQERARSQRHRTPMALMMLDLDHFKRINDTRGHQHGDAVLQHFVQQVQSVLRSTDRLGRWGGEEFMVLLPGTQLHEAQAVAQRIHAALAQGHALDCQLSIGLALYSDPQDSLQALIQRADEALYRAKSQGRNQTCT